MNDKPQYWLNLKTNQVEIGFQSLSIDRIGPFDSAEDAARGKEILAARAKQMREEEQRDWES
ncbi:MAG: SPOR domain-containing protein [Micrococcales bacterium]|nr:SPOR domain-containing protein [Micrococcales bacterium]MBT5431418.1 SPOR domain-containing protein [Micrococcales bacterium]MBT5847888.1 SPOR domain-containing protein [Micrococcales bacterium]MBT7925443.1 SPOR domain-containing protein [Micrococcales bacterium]